MSTRKAKVISCDNPACSYEVIQPDNGDGVRGFQISYVLFEDATHGVSCSDVFAHTDECVLPAIQERLRQAWAE